MIDQRPSVDETAMETAKIWAKRSTCPKKAVGACALLGGRPIAVGYNGAPPGMRHCSEEGCDLDAEGDCVRATHAEANAIAMAAKNGIALCGAVMYLTHFPCPNCCFLIVAAGISDVVYEEPRAVADDKWRRAHDILRAGGVDAVRLNVEVLEGDGRWSDE